jgi:hypothetical protein
MGVYIDYSFYAECPEAELLTRLRRLRRKVAGLPLARVGRIKRLDPVYQDMPLDILRRRGHHLPAAVNARLKGKSSRDYCMQCGLAAPMASTLVPKKLQRQFMRPAIELLRTTDLWSEADLPEQVQWGSITFFRDGFAFALADVMLRYGYLMSLDPGEGCESVQVGLTTLRHKRIPIWLGCGFTKTQYAAHFVTAHESVCQILDAAREVGLLYRARDTCGFHQHRDWKKAAPIVNAETTFAQVAGRMLSTAVAAAQAAGMPIEDISDPTTKNYNLIRVRDEHPPERDAVAGEST